MQRPTPTPLSAALFRAKVFALQARRLLTDAWRPVTKLEAASDLPAEVLVEVRSPLWFEADPREAPLERGKVHNLRLVAGRLDRLHIAAGQTFSFWRQVGRTTKLKGYTVGRQIEAGCLVPARGGGICQLTNALYEAALATGCEIVERHPHTRRVPNASANRPDATVAWNHVDLRFRSRRDITLRAFLTPDELVLQFLGHRGGARTLLPLAPSGSPPQANSCASCDVDGCFRHIHGPPSSGRRAVLVDRVWPEFAAYLASLDLSKDLLLVPLDPRRLQRPAYGWRTQGVGEVRAATLQTLHRGWKARRLANEGPARRRAALEADEALSRAYGAYLSPDITELVVYQQFLPYLWRDGLLGGRRFDVLMTRLPMAELHGTLDEAAARHPDRPSLADFRAPQWLVEAESEALRYARRVVTPHRAMAALFPGRATLLEWSMPSPRAATLGDAIAFPGPAIARKGAHEAREFARRLGLPLVLLGSDLMPAGFWEGIELRRPGSGEDWLKGVAVVVQPAVVEDQPRRLLEALASGVPVVASSACGLAAHSALTTIDIDSLDAWESAVRRQLGRTGGLVLTSG